MGLPRTCPKPLFLLLLHALVRLYFIVLITICDGLLRATFSSTPIYLMVSTCTYHRLPKTQHVQNRIPGSLNCACLNLFPFQWPRCLTNNFTGYSAGQARNLTVTFRFSPL
jgi:hypothetical protein